jgi:hypothetical protein
MKENENRTTGLDQVTSLSGGGRTSVVRIGDTVHRETGPWAPSVHALLRHLEHVGFKGAPRIIGTGFDSIGREILTYVEGNFLHPGPWSDGGIAEIGKLLRDLHEATATFHPPLDSVWRPWFGREMGGSGRRVFGHCDIGPWNVVARDGLPVALIDWEVGGPVDALVEFAQACWLNVQLHDDDIAKRQGLPDTETRARQVRLMADSYGLDSIERTKLVDTMIAFAISDGADQAIQAAVTPDTQEITGLWAITWRTRAAAWMIRNRALLNRALR